MGLIRYSRPEQPANDAAELYGGLSIFGSRLGAALSSDPGRNDTTLFKRPRGQPAVRFRRHP